MENISFKNLTFTYPKTEKPALKNVSFEIFEGDFCLVIGKSSAGKTTLLKLLKKEIAPFGDIKGEIVNGYNVGYVSQNVEENIVCDKVRSELSFGLTNMGLSKESIDLKVSEIASYFNLNEKLDFDISSLSGGEKQILNLASVMIMSPSVLVLDEPTCQLDPVWAERFVNVIKKLHRDFGITVIIAEHLLEELYPFSNRVLLIDNGELKADLEPFSMIDYLRQNDREMLKSIPISLSLFDGARSIYDCRKMLKEKNLTPLNDEVSMTDVSLKIKNLSFAYIKNQDILKNLSLDVYENKINVILGPNSSGKSTLLKSICGVIKPHHGKIKKAGKVSLLCQNPRDLFTKEKCKDEVEFGEITDFLEIENIREQHPYDISGGEAQRLALAKVLQTGADILLLDEPTKALDTSFKYKLGEKLRAICDSGKTVVITTHDIDFAGEFGDYISFLTNGEIITTKDRQSFFSSLDFYTTSVSKITRGIVDSFVSRNDLARGGIDV